LKTVSGESAKCKLDLVGVQKFRWDKGGTKPADDYTFYGNGSNIPTKGQVFIQKGIISTVKRLKFVSDWIAWTTQKYYSNT
jgi:hypothetical protein